MDENVSSFSIRFFSQWEAFVDLEKTRRISQERAEGFRRYSIKDLLTECEVCTGKYCLRFSYRPSDEGARSVR